MPLASRRFSARGLTGPIPIWTIVHSTSATTFTNFPLAVSEPSTALRKPADLRRVRKWQSRAVHTTVNVTDGRAGVQYSLDGGSTWFWMDGTDGSVAAASEGLVMTFAGPATAYVASAEIVAPPAARTSNVLLRVVTYGGTGGSSPAMRGVDLVATEFAL